MLLLVCLLVQEEEEEEWWMWVQVHPVVEGESLGRVLLLLFSRPLQAPLLLLVPTFYQLLLEPLVSS